jgi:hypothetical protein
MKAKMLKIAGVKTESAFYKKYPTQEAFMKAHGKAFKKAQIGTYIGGETKDQFKPVNFKDSYDNVDLSITGKTNDMRQEEAYKQASLVAQQKQGGGSGFIDAITPMLGKLAESGGEAKYGKRIPKAQFGNMFDGGFNPGNTNVPAGIGYSPMSTNLTSSSGFQMPNTAQSFANQNPLPAGVPNIGTPQSSTMDKIGGAVGKYAGPVGEVLQGYKALRAERQAVKGAQQMQQVSDLALKAANTKPEKTQRKYVRPEDMITSGNQLSPTYGTGTNALAKNGAEIQNTYAPNNLYDDLGYEPLEDSDNVKQYQNGGFPWDAAGDMGANIGGAIVGQDAGAGIGGTIGGTIGSAFGPMGKAIGKTLGTVAGGLLDRNDNKLKKAQAATNRNMQGMAFGQSVQGIQGQNAAYMEDGGYVSNDWNPQVIAKFGDHSPEDVYHFAHEGMDSLRAGGHLRNYTPSNDRAMETAQTGYTMTKSPNFIEARDTTVEYDPYLHKAVPVYTTPMEYKMGLQSATPDSSWYKPKESELGVVQMDNLRDYDILTQESNDDYTFPIADANERAATAAKYFDRSGKLSYTAGSADYKNITPDTEKTLARIHEGQTRKNGGPIKSFAMGGELKTHWGGHMEEMSENPYLPDGGVTYMPHGQSHDESDGNGRTGIGITYGDNPVEVERREPIMKLKDGSTGEDNLVVFGNLEIPKYAVDVLGDEKAKGMKFKNYVADLSKSETKQNKTIDKSINALDSFTPRDSFDKLKSSALQANILGSNMKLKEIAETKTKAAALQNAINDTAEEFSLDADHLAKGKFKTAKFGGKFTKAAYGTTTTSETTLPPTELNEVVINPTKIDYMKRPLVNNLQLVQPKLSNFEIADLSEINQLSPDNIEYEEVNNEETTDKDNPWIKAINSVIPTLRPSDAEALNANQLLGEMYAMSQNQVEPVQAQLYNPELSTPYTVSLQDQMNEITAQTRAAQRMAGNNPSAQAAIAAQAYEAINKVKGEEFRMNQGMADKTYTGNIAAMNDANKLKNLGILDQQYSRQAQAKSNTKAITQAALNSISDKYAKNALENRTLKTYENMYNYRYDASGKAINMNPLQQWGTDLNSASSEELQKLAELKAIKEKKDSKAKDKSRNGSIVRSIKNL